MRSVFATTTTVRAVSIVVGVAYGLLVVLSQEPVHPLLLHSLLAGVLTACFGLDALVAALPIVVIGYVTADANDQPPDAEPALDVDFRYVWFEVVALSAAAGALVRWGTSWLRDAVSST